MGSIFGRPKTATSTAPTTTTTQTSSAATETDNEPSISEQQATARTSSLLRRSRGRLGTITTSFKGFLDTKNSSQNPFANAQSTQRKTLLGE